jgi:hypothetical protein
MLRSFYRNWPGSALFFLPSAYQNLSARAAARDAIGRKRDKTNSRDDHKTSTRSNTQNSGKIQNPSFNRRRRTGVFRSLEFETSLNFEFWDLEFSTYQQPLQTLAKLLSRMVQAHLHGLCRAFQNLGDLCV